MIGDQRLCPACGTPLAPIESQCPRCGASVQVASSADGPTVEVTWFGEAQRPRPGLGGRKIAILVGGVAVAMALVVALALSLGGDPVASVPPPQTANTVAPTTGASPTAAPTAALHERLPRSAPVPERQFVVPRGQLNEQRLYLASAQGSLLRLRTPEGDNVNSPSLSADRQSLLYIDRTKDSVRSIAVDGSGDRHLFDRPDGCRSITHITWNPADQEELVIRCLDENDASRMILCDLRGSVLKEVNPPHARFDDPAFAPDGRSLTYWASERKQIGGGSLYVAAMDGSSGEKRLTQPGSMADADPVWSPDGSRIAFTRRVNARNTNVYSVSARGGAIRAVMTGPTIDDKPAWSPDGKQLLVVSDRDASGQSGRRLHLYLARSSGNQVKRLDISAPDLSTAVWSYR